MPSGSASGAADDLRVRVEALVAEAARTNRLGDVRAAFEAALAAHVPGRGTNDPVSASAATGGVVPDARGARTAPDANAAEPVPMRFGMVGDSAPMRAVFALLEKVAPADVSVLVHGETGTGKELVARALHDHGRRAKKPFLAENCAAVPANLLESELFGHKKGSFTGAVADRPGHFVVADGGTVFLDEIGDMPLAMQAKLLRVLQDGEVRAVGSNTAKRVDVRVVAATNKDLPSMCKAGTFREDLYFRLNVVTITLPPLRERAGDVRHLVRFFVGRIAKEMGRPLDVTPEALAALERWKWPGNVRELENVVRRAAVFAQGAIRPSDLGSPISGA